MFAFGWGCGLQARRRAGSGVLVAFVLTATFAAYPGTASGEEAVISISEPPGTSPLTGKVPVRVESSAAPVALEYSFDGGESWVALDPISDATGVGADWDTRPYSGAAILRASAGGASTELKVRIDNVAPEVRVTITPTRFSPDGDGRKDDTEIGVHVNEKADLQLEVRNSEGRIMRSWLRSGVAPGRTSFSWSGRKDGNRIADGRYSIRAQATDMVGLQDSATTPVWIDTRAPRLRIRGVSSPSDASRPVRVRYRARDAAPRVRLRLQVFDGFRTVRSRTFTRKTGRGTLSIEPRHRGGRRLFPGGYTLRLQAVDAAANGRRRSNRLVILRRVKPKVYTRLENTGRKVALTFDDCIFPDEWARILDILKRRNVKATFFCPGERIAMHPELARRVVKEGHTPAAHGWGHPMMTSLSFSDIVNRLERDRRQWAAVGGVSAPYFRPPDGAFDSTVMEAAAASFHPRIIMWDLDSRDALGASGSSLVCSAVCDARPGSIILMHTKPVTAAVLPTILDRLEAKGLKPVTLPALFDAARR